MVSSYKFKIKDRIVEFRPDQNCIILNESDSLGGRVVMSYSESKILEILIKEPGKINSRDNLLKSAWDGRVVSPGSLNQCIFNIRSILGGETSHEIIQTVPRKGYRFNADYLSVASSETQNFEGGENSPILQSELIEISPALALASVADTGRSIFFSEYIFLVVSFLIIVFPLIVSLNYMIPELNIVNPFFDFSFLSQRCEP